MGIDPASLALLGGGANLIGDYFSADTKKRAEDKKTKAAQQEAEKDRMIKQAELEYIYGTRTPNYEEIDNPEYQKQLDKIKQLEEQSAKEGPKKKFFRGDIDLNKELIDREKKKLSEINQKIKRETGYTLTGGEKEKERAFTGSESEKQRALEKALKEGDWDTALKLQQEKLGSESIEAEKARAFTGGEAEKQRSFEQANIDYERVKREEALKRAIEQSSMAEKDFMKDIDKQSPELSALQQSLETGQNKQFQEAMRQANLSAAQQGVRGGQAARLLARQGGELKQSMGTELNRLALDEAEKRRQAKQSFLASKAGSAYSKLYS